MDDSAKRLILDNKLREMQIYIKMWSSLFPYEREYVKRQLSELTQEAHEILGDEDLTTVILETIKVTTNSR